MVLSSLVLRLSIAFVVRFIIAYAKEHVVTFSDTPIWTVGIGVAYSDMVITVGESVAFASFSSHDVALLHSNISDGNPWESCGEAGIAPGSMTLIYATHAFTNDGITVKHYTPPTCGEFHFVCSIPPHCMYGQRVKVIVKSSDGAPCASPCQGPDCVTSSSKVVVSDNVVHAVKSIPNSRFWGQGRYDVLQVDIGDVVVFRTGAGFHDIATLPSVADFESCSMTSKTSVADWIYGQTLPTLACANSDDCCKAQYVTYSFKAEAAGDKYFVCSFGDHCMTGQKLHVTIKDAVSGSEAPTTDAPTASGTEAKPLVMLWAAFVMALCF